MGEADTLHPLEYRYQVNAANIVTLLGAQTAELRVTGRGIEFFAMKSLNIPKWRFHVVIGRPRQAPGHAITAHPGKIAGALHIAGAPGPRRYSYTDVYFGNGVARFIGPDGTTEISGRVTAAGSDRSAIPRDVKPLARMFVGRDDLTNGVLLALARSPDVEMRMSQVEGNRWKLHIISMADDDYDFFVNIYKPPEVEFRGLYKAWTLSELLAPVGDYAMLGFFGSADYPALHAYWDGILRDREGSAPVTTEFYLKG
jgi:hypothetical protein